MLWQRMEGRQSDRCRLWSKLPTRTTTHLFFNKVTYEGEVPEASPIGFEVIKVEATDADEPNTENSEIRYSIMSQEPAEPSMFTINPVSGAITLSADGLNREKHPQFTLMVKAENSAGATLFAQVKVTLTVTANSASMTQAGGAKRRKKRFSVMEN
ncbi:cadherin-2-like [Poeciliopsis prolifica]|uniref:cadherin-2-like n=1 Tax=Poeciliopsis prolifica TaxID=188132 RepID=UPI00241408FD|nr:cadherin-2-like [Poeciliopsis prolifica]